LVVVFFLSFSPPAPLRLEAEGGAIGGSGSVGSAAPPPDGGAGAGQQQQQQQPRRPTADPLDVGDTLRPCCPAYLLGILVEKGFDVGAALEEVGAR